jgi:hypothetical protein
MGDKEVDVSSEFKLYLTTKLPNPNYAPEISTKALIVNFAVKMSGLEAQLLDTVVKHERPELAKQKSDLVVKVSLRPQNALTRCWGHKPFPEPPHTETHPLGTWAKAMCADIP